MYVTGSERFYAQCHQNNAASSDCLPADMYNEQMDAFSISIFFLALPGVGISFMRRLRRRNNEHGRLLLLIILLLWLIENRWQRPVLLSNGRWKWFLIRTQQTRLAR